MAHLILLIGLPGSGKSTLAKHLVQSQGCRLVSTDEIRANLFGDEAVQGPWPLIWREVERSFRSAAAIGKPSHALDPLLLEASQTASDCTLYDATNAVRRQRRAVIRLARDCGFQSVSGLWLDVPLALCLERNLTRDRQVPEPVVERMHRCLVGAPPSLHEGLDALLRLPSDLSSSPNSWDSGWSGKPHPQFS